MEHQVTKSEKAFEELVKREEYLVTQANELARSFGNLSALEHKVLDYCFSFVQRKDTQNKIYNGNILDVIHHLGLTAAGKNYLLIGEALKSLNRKTSITLHRTRPDGKRSLLLTHLFDYVEVIEDGQFKFRFSGVIEPYVFQLRKRFYSFHLSELALVKSKYSLILLKLWNANAPGWRDYKDPNGLPPAATISGSLDEWEDWFLNVDKDEQPIRWPAGRFKQNVLDRALKELEHLYPKVMISLEVEKYKRKVIGYTVRFRPIYTAVPLD